MPRLIKYLAPEPITVDALAAQCQLMADQIQPVYEVLAGCIAAARQQAEQISGSAIRLAEYQDDLPHTGPLCPLGVGGVREVTQVLMPVAEGDDQPAGPYRLRRAGVDAWLEMRAISASVPVTATYTAGLTTLDEHPGVRQWLLLSAAWLFEQREIIAAGPALNDQPPAYLHALLASITVRPKV